LQGRKSAPASDLSGLDDALSVHEIAASLQQSNHSDPWHCGIFATMWVGLAIC